MCKVDYKPDRRVGYQINLRVGYQINLRVDYQINLRADYQINLRVDYQIKRTVIDKSSVKFTFLAVGFVWERGVHQDPFGVAGHVR